jgi:hypothetical protein
MAGCGEVSKDYKDTTKPIITQKHMQNQWLVFLHPLKSMFQAIRL